MPVILDSIVVAAIVATLVSMVLAEARARRKSLLRHLRNVAELNHQVRNALQTIVYSNYLAPPQQAAAVLESVNRIDRTLRELFPATEKEAQQNQEAERRVYAVPSKMPTESTQPPSADDPERHNPR
jgi:hypothetical protein